MPLTKNQNPLGRGIDFFAQDRYFNLGTEVLGKASTHLLTGVHAGTMVPLGVAYDATRRIINAPVQMVGLIASLLPKKEEKEAETVKVEVVSETPAKPAAKKKPVAKKKPLKDLQDLPEDLVPGTA